MPKKMNACTQFLKLALQQAQTRRGFCAPNPAVGAVIVKDNVVIAEGCHWQAGEAHAEAAALQKLNHQAQDCTIYVTLEPCCHYGKTPPCTEAIIKSGIKKVVYAFQDPHSKVNGGGAQALITAGIDCQHYPIPEISTFYQSYQYWLQTGKPWVTAKIAMSEDGKIAGPNGERIQLTGEEANQYTQLCRLQSDAILTTARTINHDNPQMNARVNNNIIAKLVYVLDSQLSLQLDKQILKTAKSLTVFHQENINADKRKQFESVGIHCVATPSDEQGLNLDFVIRHIDAHDLWVEVGAKALSSLFRAGLVNKMIIYLADITLDEQALSVVNDDFNLEKYHHQITWQALGSDKLAIFYP